MYFLIAGTAIFFAVHLFSAFRSRVPGKDARERLGYARFMGIYSIIALIGFALMVWGYNLARPSPQILPTFVWGKYATWILMLPAFILLVSAYAPRGFIKDYVKHPMLMATILWSFGHLLANGELNSLILFGSFLAFALIDRLRVAGRPEPVKKKSSSGDILSVAIGAVLYFSTLLFLHGRLIGVPLTS